MALGSILVVVIQNYDFATAVSLAIGLTFVYELRFCDFESSSSHLNFGFRVSLEQVVPLHSGKYRI